MPPRLPSWIALTIAIAVVVTTLALGAHAVGGADSQGYASQAEGWLTGSPVVERPDLRTDPPPFALEAAAPLGWALSTTRDGLVPTYAPGYPLLMTAARVVAGHAAIFLVTPLMAGLLVWGTFLLGRRVADDWVGVAAAVLVATSPTAVFQSMMPMSDVPSAALWAGTLLLTLSRSRRVAALSGVVAGVAILVRPNLAPLLVICVVWRAWRDRPDWRPAALMAACAVPAIVALASINHSWYGGPLRSGYGDLSYYYDWGHVWPNVINYSRWWTSAEGSIVALAIIGSVWVLRTRRFSASSPLTLYALAVVFVAATYIPYAVFEVWTYLRFWLPILPVLAVLAALGARALVLWLPSGRLRIHVRVDVDDLRSGRARVLPLPSPRWIVGGALAAVVLAVNFNFAKYHDVFLVGLLESRYPQVATVTAELTRPGDVILTMQHSGTVPYYGGRETMRWDIIEPHLFDGAIEWLQARHNEVWLLLDEFEVEALRARSAEGRSVYGLLDWGPSASFFRGDTLLFRVADRGKDATYPPRFDEYTRRPIPSALSR